MGNTKINKFKSLNKIYFHSKNLNKISEAVLSVLPKPKGTNNEILKRQAISFKNEENLSNENFGFEKIESILDLFVKNCSFEVDEESGEYLEYFVVDFAECESKSSGSSPFYNSGKNKYE